MTDKNDPFRDLVFNGTPSDYRLFRRKIMLNIAAMEGKHIHLAGPKILTKLTGEAWRATEHLAIQQLRSENGWLQVIKALDAHYRYLPETELNECVDEFLFGMKRKSGEGPTAFVSRFKTALTRLENLIAADKVQQEQTTKRRRRGQGRPDDSPLPPGSSSSTSGEEEDVRVTKARVEAAAAAGSRWTQKADDEGAQRKMLESLGQLEVGHLRRSPVFPSVVLGHLFMRKYGLSREQRSQVVRSTGGSCKFEDVEKVLRASDFEDGHHRHHQLRPARKDNVMAADGGSESMSEPSVDHSSAEVNELEDDVTEDDEVREELEEAYALQRKSRDNVKKHFRSYKESRKKIQEIKKQRQPYMPVVALPPGTDAPAAGSGQIQPTFRYDKKKTAEKEKTVRKTKKETVNLAQGSLITEFSYMIHTTADDDLEVLSASVPTGTAVIDTGATTSVIGEETAARYIEYFRSRGIPEPQEVALPPVQIKGFNDVKSSTKKGLQWLVCLGCLWGTVTTYVVPGSSPFLLSRKVLEGMEATINLGNKTLSSLKHHMKDVPLSQAANGHLLMPLLPETDEVFHALPEQVHVAQPGHGSAARISVEAQVETQQTETSPQPPPAKRKNTGRQARLPEHTTVVDRKRQFQTVLKNTRYTQVDVGTYRYAMRVIFGMDTDAALCAYRPRFERIPKQAAQQTVWQAVATLSPDGTLAVSSWHETSSQRAAYSSVGTCIFAYRWQRPVQEQQGSRSPQTHGSKGSPKENIGIETPEQNPKIRKDKQGEYPHSVGPVQCVPPCESTCQRPSARKCSVAGVCHKHLPEPAVPQPIAVPARNSEANSLEDSSCEHSPETVRTCETKCDCCSWIDKEVSDNPDLSPKSLGDRNELEAMYEDVNWVSLEHQPIPAKSRLLIARQVEQVRKAPFQLALAVLREDPSSVRRDLKEWLGDQKKALGQAVGLIEVFTGRAPLSVSSERHRGLTSIRLGLQHGQDFSRARDRRLLLLLIAWCRPKDVWLSWPCNPWCAWSRMNLHKGGNAAEGVLKKRQEHRVFLRLAEHVWQLQVLVGGHVHAENPQGSAAWAELQLGLVFEADFHMCALGLKCPKTGGPVMKPTRVITTDPALAEVVRQWRCPGHENHAHLEGTHQGRSLTSFAETYPKQFCNRVAKAFASRDADVCVDHDIFMNTEDEADSERESEPDAPPAERELPRPDRQRYIAMVQKLHVNTGHASIPQMLRLAHRAKAPQQVVDCIKQFKCSVCEELQVPPSHKVAALRHTETPNELVGIDVVQVELKKDTPSGPQELKYDVMTVVDYASDFAQQIVLSGGPGTISKAFHAVWCRPYGPPKIVYVDPDQRWMSGDFQRFLQQHSITLLDAATESHWQLGRVEIAQRILRGMAQRVWRTSDRPPEEVIETCAAVRNEQLKRHGFSSAQWFLGRDPRVPGSLADCSERQNLAVQDAIGSDKDFATKMYNRKLAAHAFVEAHAHSVWSRSIRGRNRPLRGPYVIGQQVYVFRRQGRGLLSTRHGVWKGPGRIVGTESFREDSPVPRVIWVVINGFMYKCSPECLRPVAEDEQLFRELAQQLHSGNLHPELEHATPARGGPAGRFFDLTREHPTEEDFIRSDDSMDDEPDRPDGQESPAGNLVPEEDPQRNVRRRITHNSDYWQDKSHDFSPRGRPSTRVLDEEGEQSSPKQRRVELESDRNVQQPAVEDVPASSSSAAVPAISAGTIPTEPGNSDASVADPDPTQTPLPDEEGESVLYAEHAMCCEVSFDVYDTDISSDEMCLWTALEQCAQVASRPAQKRRVEVSY